MAKYGSFTDFQLKSVKIYPSDGGGAIEVKSLVNSFNYVESITAPFLSATMEVVDSAGLLQGLPIQGAETVEVEVLTSFSEEAVKYVLVIWKVANRFAQNQKQAYTLGLISSEALNNEVMRVEKRLEGNPGGKEGIVSKLLKESLKTNKEFYTETSKFNVKILSNAQRPFDIIATLAIRSVSPKASNETSSSKAEESDGKTTESVRGTGGFFFWESRRGYNFFSVDSLCADKGSPLKSDDFDVPSWGPYVETVANQGGNDERFTIYQSVFGSELDLLSSLRKGKYSSLITFFNHSTGQYAEYQYKIKDSYDNMAHLGGQESISLVPSNQVELSSYPTRRMSYLLDHETWYNDSEIASPNPDDGSESPTQFADWQMFYAAQSIARYQLLKNQSCTIVIPGNPDICAGDKIDIRLQNKVPNKEAKREPFDVESSGVYLIQEATHTYDTTIGTNGRFTTTLRLLRDSYGMKDKQSKHGTK
jgi:hypothetical protein